MAHKFPSDETLAGQWSIRKIIVPARQLIDEAEKSILQEGTLPQGLVHRLHETINSMEAEILRRQAALSFENQHDDTENLDLGRSTAIAHREDELQASLSSSKLLIDAKALDGHGPRKETERIIKDRIPKFDALQDNIKALQSVVFMYMTNSRPLKKRKTSDKVYFSILEDKKAILDLLLEHLYEPSNDVNNDTFQEKLSALSARLIALFNMEIKEAAQERRGSIDDQIMMRIVTENQKRTELLRHIESVDSKIKDLKRDFRDHLGGN